MLCGVKTQHPACILTPPPLPGPRPLEGWGGERANGTIILCVNSALSAPLRENNHAAWQIKICEICVRKKYFRVNKNKILRE